MDFLKKDDLLKQDCPESGPARSRGLECELQLFGWGTLLPKLENTIVPAKKKAKRRLSRPDEN